MVVESQPRRKPGLNSQFIRRKLRSCDDLLNSGHHITRISLMSSEEPKSAHTPLPTIEDSRHHHTFVVEEEENDWKDYKNYMRNKMDEIIAFARAHSSLATTILFWMFLPITLPLYIFKTIVRDLMKLRQIYVLTLEGVIMQLELMVEMISCIHNSNSSIDAKIERMGRSFYFLNLLNPLFWTGVISHAFNQGIGPAKGNIAEETEDKNTTTGNTSPQVPAVKKIESETEPRDSTPTKNPETSATTADSHVAFSDEKDPDVANNKHSSDEDHKENPSVDEKQDREVAAEDNNFVLVGEGSPKQVPPKDGQNDVPISDV